MYVQYLCVDLEVEQSLQLNLVDLDLASKMWKYNHAFACTCERVNG